MRSPTKRMAGANDDSTQAQGSEDHLARIIHEK
jgi:hypothetical protein